MLTANTKNGKTINLLNYSNRFTLEKLREQMDFYCPVCKEKLHLKLGTKRIFHFSHEKGSQCVEYYERESEAHLDGKIQLFEWLRAQRINSVLEAYDPNIKQRADIAFDYNEKKYVIEYQCSPISKEIFLKRTRQFLKQNVTPIWIIGATTFQRKGANKLSLTNFHYLFVKQYQHLKWMILYYCSKSKIFIRADHLNAITTKNTLANFTFTPIHKMKLTDLLIPMNKRERNLHLTDWKDEIMAFKANYFLHPGLSRHPFLKQLYVNHMYVQFLPPEIGLPVHHHLLIETPTVVWQAYLYIDFFKSLKCGDAFSFQQVYSHFKRRVVKGDIRVRFIPFANHAHPSFVVINYLQLLVKIGHFKLTKDGSFIVKKLFVLPNNTKECEEMHHRFYEQYKQMLNDPFN